MEDRKVYLVQWLIDTDLRVLDNRVATFIGRVRDANCATAHAPGPGLRHFDPDVEDVAISSHSLGSDRRWHADVLHQAERVHAGFAGVPVLKTDILRGARIGEVAWTPPPEGSTPRLY